MTHTPTIDPFEPRTDRMSRVITHDGYRAAQTPVAIIFQDERFDVTTIEDSWISTGVESNSPIRHGYLVRCRGGGRFRIEHIQDGGWDVELLPGPRLSPSYPDSRR